MDASQKAKYDRIIDLEHAFHVSKLTREFRMAGASQYLVNRQDASIAADRKRLYDIIDSLTPEELREYGDYRLKSWRVAAVDQAQQS